MILFLKMTGLPFKAGIARKPRYSKKCLSSSSGLPRKTCNKLDSVVTFLRVTTYMSPFRSSTSQSHHSETDNMDTAIKKTHKHKCTYQGQKSWIPRHRILRRTWNLQNGQDSSKKVSSETLPCHNLKNNLIKSLRKEQNRNNVHRLPFPHQRIDESTTLLDCHTVGLRRPTSMSLL